jgi:membrane protein
MIFKILPDAKIEWKHVWFGSIVTGILFTIGKMLLAYYFGQAQPASVYGATSSIILILLWVSYSSMILFFGAEFTAAYAKMYSGIIPPTDIAKVIIPTATEKAM